MHLEYAPRVSIGNPRKRGDARLKLKTSHRSHRKQHQGRAHCPFLKSPQEARTGVGISRNGTNRSADRSLERDNIVQLKKAIVGPHPGEARFLGFVMPLRSAYHCPSIINTSYNSAADAIELNYLYFTREHSLRP